MPLPTSRTSTESNYLKKIYMFYGQPKAGKTTIASQFGDDDKNKVIFFATEPGHKFQTIYKWRYQKNGEYHDPISYNHFITCAKELLLEKHEFKCLVIDTIDILYSWAGEHIAKKSGEKTVGDIPHGKGWSLLHSEIMRPVNALCQSGLGVIFISHESIKEKTLTNKKINYTDSSMTNHLKKMIDGLCDYILYFYIDKNGNRVIRTKGNTTINAGDRSGLLPELIKMDSKELITHLNKGE